MVHGEMGWVWPHLPFFRILVRNAPVQDAGTGRISFVVV